MDSEKFKALHNPVSRRCGCLEEVESLLNEGVDPDSKNSDGETPLMKTVRNSRKDIAELLINSGANINCCDDENWSVLHYAIIGGCKDILQWLLNKTVSLDVMNFEGETPLMLAARCCRRDFVKLLINSGADINCRDARGWTILHHDSADKEIVQLLVKKGFDVNVRNSDGFTPLHLAIKCKKLEVVDSLLKAGADCNLEDNCGKSSFNVLTQKPNVGLIRLCIEKGAYVKYIDYDRLLSKSWLKNPILQDKKLCSLAIINKFNNKDLPAVYKVLVSAERFPNIDNMKIGRSSRIALEVEQAVAHEIQVKGYCNLMVARPLVLSIMAIKPFLDYVQHLG